MSMFWTFAKRPEPESWIWQLSAKAKGKRFKQLTDSERFCADSVDTCIMASGNEGDDGLWVTKDMCYMTRNQLATTILSTEWSLTVGGVSNPRSLAEPCWLDVDIDPETGTKIGGPGDSVSASVANDVEGAWSMPTTGTILSCEIL